MSYANANPTSFALELRKLYGKTLRPACSHISALALESFVGTMERCGISRATPLDQKLDTLTLGIGDGRWTICPGALPEQPVCYSFGVGYDISFDLALVRRFSAEVHAFDPTSRSGEWLANQRLPKGFQHHAIGLSNQDGQCEFTLPAGHSVSFSTLDIDTSDRQPGIKETCEVRQLASITKMLGHPSVDILKIDIEGAEYQLIDDLIEQKQTIGQLLIEFHSRMLSESEQGKTEAAIASLQHAGFQLFHVSARKTEFSFINPDFYAATDENMA